MSTPHRADPPDAPDASELRIGIAASRDHPRISEALLDRAILAVEAAGAHEVVVRCSGTRFLPVICQQLAADVDAVVALGVILREGTTQFEEVCRALTAELARVCLDERTPVGDGVLTADDEQYALGRAGLPRAHEDMGYDIVLKALDAALVLRNLRG